MSRRKLTFENIKFFNKKTLRKYVRSNGVLLDKNQKSLTFLNVNDDENSFRRKDYLNRNPLVSTQQLPVDNSNFANNVFFGSAEVKVNIAFEKIINKYPFDGPFDSVERFEDRLSSFEKYVFDRFPKSLGFLRFDSSKNQFIRVRDKSGYLTSALLKGEPGKQSINPEDKSFSVEMCLRIPEKTDFNQNSYLFHCVNTTDTVANGFAAFIEGFSNAIASISVRNTSFGSNPAKILTIRDLSRTVNFTPDGNKRSATKVDANNYTFGTKSVAEGDINKVAIRISDAIDLALSNNDLLVTGSVIASRIFLTQRQQGRPLDVNIDGTATTGDDSPIIGGDFTNFSKNSGTTKIKFVVLSGSNTHVSASYEMKKGHWQNLNFVYDRSTSRQFLSINTGSLMLAQSNFFNFSTINTGGVDLYIGSGPGNLVMPGNQKVVFDNRTSLSASMDEFRLFHNLRNTDEIDYFSRRDIFSHDNLKVLFNFNEPTGSHANNDIVLDRSGNSLHSRIENFDESVRDPGVIKNPMFLQKPEYNPILFPGQIDVINLNSDLLELATDYDINNPNKITKLIPSHYLEDGFAESGITVDGEIVESYESGKNLPGGGRIGSSQLMHMLLYFIAEQFDSYKMYIDQASQLLFPDYLGEEGVADSFLQDLASYYGYELPSIFGQAAQNQFEGKENLGIEYATYERSLSEVQSMIWRRVLKNLNYIISGKGTKDSIKSLFRSSGIEPDRLFRMVEYHNKNEFRLGSARQSITEMSTLLDFSGSMSPRLDAPKGDGTFSNYPTLISAPLSGSRIEPGFPDISGGNVLGTAKIIFHPTNASSIPSNGTIITVQDAFRNIHQFEFTDTALVQGLTNPRQATAIITVDDGDQVNHTVDVLSYATITSFDGLERKYVLVQGAGAVPTGTVLKVNDDYGDGRISSPENDSVIGGIAVTIPNGGSKRDILEQLKYAIEGATGHDKRILVGATPPIATKRPLTGALTIDGTSNVVGSGTKFLSEVNVNDVLIINSESKIVRSIATDTALTVDSNFTSSFTGQATANGANGLQKITLTQKVLAGSAVANRSIVGFTTVNGAFYRPSTSNFVGGLNTLVSRKDSSAITFTVPNADLEDAATPVSALDYIEISTGSGENKKYVIVTGASAVANGTVLEKDSNYGSGTIPNGSPLIGGVAVNVHGVNKLNFLINLRAAIISNQGHGIKVSGVLSNISGEPAVLTIRSVNPAKFIISTFTANISSGRFFPTTGYALKTVPEIVDSFSKTITGSFGDSLRVSTKRSTSTSNVDTIKLETKDFSRNYLNQNLIQVNNANPGEVTSSPYLSASGFSGGNGFVKAGNIGYENNGISATKIDGLFTSGSWTVDGIYEFSSNLPEGKERSLSRIIATGDQNNDNWKDKHAVLTNLVLSSKGDTITLFARPTAHVGAPLLSLPLTGANFLNGQKWYVAYGRQRNDEISLENESMYFIKAASYTNDKVTSFLEASSIFDETIRASGNRSEKSTILFQNNSIAANNSFTPARIIIGKHNFFSPADDLFLNSLNEQSPDMSGNDVAKDRIVIPNLARTNYFDAKVGHLKFWSKALTKDECFEHARNFKSVGVDRPLSHNTFSSTASGSFGRLRLNISTDQVEKNSNPEGLINLIDFAQTFVPVSGSAGLLMHQSGAFGYGFEASKKVIKNERFDYTILSPFYDDFVDDDRIKIAGFSEGKNVKTFNSKIAPVTEILPFEKEVLDNRFEIQINLQRALNEDIMNIFSSMDALDNALGQPNLQFSREYPDLKDLRNLYFDRLTDKVNYRNFFDLFRWIDDAFSDMVTRLIPRNVDFLGINLIIESHALERYKVAYGHHEIYKGEDERANLRSVLLVSQRSGVIKRF